MDTKAPLNFGTQLHDPGFDGGAARKQLDDVFAPPELSDSDRARARRAGRNNMKSGIKPARKGAK